MSTIRASTALAHLRILDLSRARAGPTCTRQFADFGADVIKIEALAGTDANDNMVGPRHGSDFQNLHRNKRSITLNLKEPQGREVFMKLVETADVVVENFRPDVKLRLGIDYESLKVVNPRIILASISGFGQDGPYRDRPGFDQIAQGMSGLMSVTGAPGKGPMRVGAAVMDVSTGVFVAFGIMTALIERDTSGEGQWVQCSLLHSGVSLLDFQAARYLMEGEVPQQFGNEHPTTLPTSAYTTADGHVNVAAPGEGMWVRLCKAIEREDLLDRAEFQGEKKLQNRAALDAELNAALSRKKSSEWIDLLNRAGVPCGPIYAMDEVFADPQVEHLQVAAKVNHPTLGEVRLISQAVRLSRTPATMAAATPELSEHTDEVLADLGYSPADILGLRAKQII
ncbi:MAG: CoA transferase [Pseudomonadota bacterium]